MLQCLQNIKSVTLIMIVHDVSSGHSPIWDLFLCINSMQLHASCISSDKMSHASTFLSRVIIIIIIYKHKNTLYNLKFTFCTSGGTCGVTD